MYTHTLPTNAIFHSPKSKATSQLDNALLLSIYLFFTLSFSKYKIHSFTW